MHETQDGKLIQVLQDAIQTAREQFSFDGIPAFNARLRLAGQQSFGTDQQSVTKTNWATLVPQVSILLISQAPPSEAKKKENAIPVPEAKPKKSSSRTLPKLSAKYQLALGKKAKEPKVFIVIQYGKTLRKRFTIRPYKPLGTIFNEFATVIGEDRDVLRFYVKDQSLEDTSTVNSVLPGLDRSEDGLIKAAKVLKIALQGGGVTKRFAAMSNRSLRGLEKGWAKARGVNRGEFQFRFKGTVLAFDLKLQDIGMDTGDIIEVI